VRKNNQNKKERITYHVAAEVFLLFLLKPLQILQHPGAGILDVPLGDL
jgi:hypothetical protein